MSGAPSTARWAARRVSDRLPAFPWDRLAPYRQTAQNHPDGSIDLSIGSPRDPVPEVIQRALADGANHPGYPQTQGTPELRDAAARWLSRSCGVSDITPAAVLPTIGSKELVAGLPWMLGLGPGDQVVLPQLGYPTYDAGVRLAGADPVVTDSLTALGPARPGLLWVNSPGNPTGRVLPPEHLRKVVEWARERGVVVASDECYIGLGWEVEPVSILDPEVCGGSYDGLLALHSLSKRSNLAGYRAGLVAGDPALIGELLDIRRHAGLIVPAPVQAAMVAALDDDEHAVEQRIRYSSRRSTLWPALERVGWRIEHSEAGLYLWATHPSHDCWESVGRLAELGILVSPGELYGNAGRDHVRLALTATDERTRAAADRLCAQS